MKCKNCGAELMEGIMFCPECGEMNDPNVSAQSPVDVSEATAKLADPVPVNPEPSIATPSAGQPMDSGTKKFCPQCGTALNVDAEFCGNCGYSFSGEAQAPKEKKKFEWKKGYTIAAAAVAAVLVVVALISVVVPKIFSSGSKKSGIDKLVYLKDNEINIKNGSKITTIEEDYYDDDDDATVNSSTQPIQFTDDGKYLFFPVDYDYSTYDLYRKKVSSKKDDAEKIDSDISSYKVISDDKVIYLKDGKLYLYSIKSEDKQKVASDVTFFNIINDGKYIFWRNSDTEAYIQDINLKNDKVKLASDYTYIRMPSSQKYILWLDDDDTLYAREISNKSEKQKIASDVSQLLYFSDDLSKIIYADEDALYVVNKLDKKEKIDDDVTGAYIYTDSDTDTAILYYTKADTQSYKISDFIDDDLYDSDKKDDSDSADNRNDLRQYFDNTVEVASSDYYYYDVNKGKSELVTTLLGSYGYDSISTASVYYADYYSDNSYYYDYDQLEEYVVNAGGYSCSTSNGVTLAYYFDIDNIKKLKFSELYDEYAYWDWWSEYDFIYEITDEIVDLLSDSDYLACAISGNSAVELDVSDYDDVDYDDITIYANASSGALYMSISNYDKDGIYKGNYTLVKTNLSKDKGKLTEITDEMDKWIKLTDDGAYYMVDVSSKSSEGDLYLDGTQMLEDVYAYYISFSDSKEFYYYQDVKDSSFTLLKYNGKKSVSISEDVADYLELEDGTIALLVDYSTKRNEGDLKLYSNGKIKDIDTEVSMIVRY